MLIQTLSLGLSAVRISSTMSTPDQKTGRTMYAVQMPLRMLSCTANLLRSEQLSKDEMKCHQSLIHADYLTYRSEVARHHSGTLKWILEHNHYKNWARLTETDNSAFLWISGNPGCGKTVLSRFLMELIEASLKARQMTRQCVLYFFFDDKYDTQKSATSFLRALLHQIIRLIPGLIRHAIPEYRSQGDAMVNSLATLWKIFLAVTEDQTALDGIYIVVDALDECQEESRESLSRYFRDYFDSRRSANANTATFLTVLVTSRPYAKIERQLSPAFCTRLKTENDEGNINRDITSFIED
jgi:Cdc6-like AAA superfamily ATPase